MAKKIIKELIITILLIIAILLIISVLLYEYIPMNVSIPTVETYSSSEEIKEELAVSSEENSIVITTYTVDSSDLQTYEDTNSYVPGKANPFATYETTDEVEDETVTGSSSSSSSSSSRKY